MESKKLGEVFDLLLEGGEALFCGVWERCGAEEDGGVDVERFGCAFEVFEARHGGDVRGFPSAVLA